MDQTIEVISNPHTTSIAILANVCFSVLASFCTYYLVMKACCKKKRCVCRVQLCERIPDYQPVPEEVRPQPQPLPQALPKPSPDPVPAEELHIPVSVPSTRIAF